MSKHTTKLLQLKCGTAAETKTILLVNKIEFRIVAYTQEPIIVTKGGAQPS